jgi:hypothetical protein
MFGRRQAKRLDIDADYILSLKQISMPDKHGNGAAHV